MDKEKALNILCPQLPTMFRTYLNEKGLSSDQIDDAGVAVLKLYKSIIENSQDNFSVYIRSSGAVGTYRKPEDLEKLKIRSGEGGI